MAKSASSRRMLADLPPSSSDTGLMFSAASCMTRRPARVEPVKETMSTLGCAAMASPTTGPTPVTRLKTPGGQAHLVDDLGQDEGVDRRHLAGLEDDGAADGQGRRHLEGDLVERVVPRRDGADDADRLVHDEGVADLLFPREALRRVGRVGEGPGRQPDLDGARQRHGHADLVRDDLGHLVGAGGQGLADALEQLAALLARGGGPGRGRRPPRPGRPCRRPRACPRGWWRRPPRWPSR